MPQNKYTTFIHNNLILTILISLILGGGVSALAFSVLNPSTKKLTQSNSVNSSIVTQSSSSPQIKSSSVSSSILSSSIISSSILSSSSEEAKKELIKETPKVAEVEKPNNKTNEIPSNFVADKLIRVDTKNLPFEVSNLELIKVRVGGINVGNKITLGDNQGRVYLFSEGAPYWPPTSLSEKVNFNGKMKPRTDVGELVFEPVSGYITTNTESLSTSQTNASLTVPIKKKFVNENVSHPVYREELGSEFYEFETNNNEFIQVPKWFLHNTKVEICTDYIGKCDFIRYRITTDTEKNGFEGKVYQSSIFDEGFKIETYTIRY